MGERDDHRPIVGDGLELELVPLDLLRSVAAGAGPTVDWLGMDRPSDLLIESMPARQRLRQIEADPSVAPWLLRLIVVRGPGNVPQIAGSLGGHDRPDRRGMVEIGYTVDPAFRGRGLAIAAAAAWFDWAGARGAAVARIQTTTDNLPSLAVIRRLGLVRVGEAWDEEDQVWEQAFEAPLPLQRPRRERG